jgi:hypothetical protein
MNKGCVRSALSKTANINKSTKMALIFIGMPLLKPVMIIADNNRMTKRNSKNANGNKHLNNTGCGVPAVLYTFK